MKKKKIRKEISWACFQCGYMGGSNGINIICGKCETKLKYINFEDTSSTQSKSTFALCEKCGQKIHSPLCGQCGKKMLPYNGTFEEWKNPRNWT